MANSRMKVWSNTAFLSLHTPVRGLHWMSLNLGCGWAEDGDLVGVISHGQDVDHPYMGTWERGSGPRQHRDGVVVVVVVVMMMMMTTISV